MKKSPHQNSLHYPGAPFVEEFINRFGIGIPGLISHASNCYRERGIAPIPNWQDFCYLPVNVAVGYCQELGLDDETASFNAKLMATAQAFLASQLALKIDVTELRAAWSDPCTGPIPFDDLMNVPTFGYYVDLTPIEAEAHGCGAFVSWEDRFGFAPTRGTTLHVVRGARLSQRVDGDRFVPVPLEIPLLRGKTVRECIYKYLDDAMLNGVDTNSQELKDALDEGLEFIIDYSSRVLRLVSLVNYKLAYEEDLPKYFCPVELGDGAAILRECTTLQI